MGRTLFVVFGLLIYTFSSTGLSQVSLTALGTTYYQDFNSLANSGSSSTLPTGWAFSESGTNANTTYTAGTGSSTTGDTYSFGASGSTERAFGGLRSNSLIPTIGVSFTNITHATITALTISYVGELWRLGTRNRFDSLRFEVSFDASSLTTGTWTSVADLSFGTPDTSGVAGSRDGNSSAFRVVLNSTISGLSLPHGATFWVRWIDIDASGSDDGLAVDDFSLTPDGFSASSDIQAANNEMLNIDYASFSSSTINETSNGVRVWSFTIRDGGGSADGDELPTILSAVTITQGEYNGIPDWSTVIRQATLFDGSSKIADATAIGATSLVFSGLSGTSVTAPDDGSKTIDLYLTFKTTVADNSQFQFQISSSDVSAASGGTSSGFASFSAQTSDVSGDKNRIEVTATKLSFMVSPPSVVPLNADFSVAVAAQDANQNTDHDYTTDITLSRETGMGTLSALSGLTRSPTAGVASWTDLRYDTVEDGVRLRATSGTLTQAFSSSFNVIASASSDVVAIPSSEANSISSLENTAGPLSTSQGVQVWQISVRDGGGSADTDNLPTLLTAITFSQASGNSVASWSAVILSADLFEGSTHRASGTISTTSITFSGLSVSVPDDGSTTLTLKISLKSPLPAGSDNQAFRFAVRASDVTAAHSSVSSQFASFPDAVSASGKNAIDVLATKLVFTVQPQSQKFVGENIGPVEVTAQDANGNIDLDFAGTVTLSSSTFTLASTDAGGLAHTAGSGVASWTNLSSATTGSGTVVASSGTLASATSSTIVVLSTTVVSVQNGLWSDASTWDQLTVPLSNQSVVINHTVTLTSSATVSAVTINSGATLEAQALFTATTFTVNNGGTYIHNANGSTSNGSSADFPGTTRILQPASTVVFKKWANGGTSPTALPSGISWGNVTIDIATLAGSWNQSGNLTTIQGNLTIITTGGTTREFRLVGSGALTMTIAGDLVIRGGILNVTNTASANSQVLNIGGNFVQTGGTFTHLNTTTPLTLNFTGNNKTFTQSAGTLTNTNINWNVGPGALLSLNSNLAVAASRTLTIHGTLVCGTRLISGAGSVTVANGGTLAVGSTNTTDALTGNITATGALTLSTGSTVELNGSGAQFLGARTFKNLTVNNSVGVTLSGQVNVEGTLALLAGVVTTGAHTLTIASTGSVTRTNGYVVGNLARGVLPGSTTLSFEVGTNTRYTPALISFNTVVVGGTITVNVTTGAHPNIGNSGIRNSKRASVYWTVSNGGVQFDHSTLTLTHNGLITAGNPSDFILKRYNGQWLSPTLGPVTTTSVQATGITGFSDFVVGEPAPVKLAIVSVNGGNMPLAGSSFPVVVEARGENDAPLGVEASTAVLLRVHSGSGILGGTVSGTITAGSNSVALSGVTYTVAESGVQLRVTRTDGDVLADATSAQFTVLPGTATQIMAVSGMNQSAMFGSTLPNPLVVRVADPLGNPVSAVPVLFTITQTPSGASGQALSVTASPSDASGRVSTVLTLGNKVGSYTVTATATGITGTAVFNATAVAGPAAVLLMTSGNYQQAPILTTLPQPLVVTVLDASNNPVQGKEVSFGLSSAPFGQFGAGVSPASVLTDASGQARATLTVGSKVGVYTVAAYVAGLAGSPVQFSSTAVTGLPTSIVPTSGNNQTGTVGATLRSPFVVTVTDFGGNPLPGINISFRITGYPHEATGQSLSVAGMATNANGQASTVLTLGNRAGVYAVTAFSPSMNASVVFSAIASPLSTVVTVEAPPVAFTLFPNYPNPFNASTTIRFGVPEESRVRLDLFNILGSQITTMLDDRFVAGTYAFTWSPQDVPSGVYMLRMTAHSATSGTVVVTRRLTVMK